MTDVRPTFRALDVQRTEDGIVLVDRLGISEPAFVPHAMVPIAGRCTGERTIAEIHRDAAPQYEAGLSLQQVEDVVQQLDERLLLEGERFDAALERAATAFLAGGVRPASHAGSAGYPADPAALERALDGMLAEAECSPAHPHIGARSARGLIAPHIDLARGAAGYGAAYRYWQQAGPADLYVLFGTAHAGPTRPVTGLGLDWQTPLGTTATDRAFVDAVHAHTGAPTPHDLLLHRGEHSLEFEVLWLQHLHRRCFGGRAFRVAGFLCGPLPSAAGDPLQEAWFCELLDAFRRAASEVAEGARVAFVAGADLAHIGPFFGDAARLDDRRADVLGSDEALRLQHLQRGAPGAFHASIVQRRNPDRVCSAPAITLCAALAGGPGELLHYGQARAPDDSQLVSFCAMGFAGVAAER